MATHAMPAGGVLPAAVLAVDGGNSKTDLALLRDDGTVLAVARHPTASHQAVGIARALSSLIDWVLDLADHAAPPVARIGSFCLAGIDLDADERSMGDGLRRAQLTVTTHVRNDTFAAMRAGSTGRGWSIALVCGAGMNCVAQPTDGPALRFPALGDISGDFAAGGEWVGWRAHGAAVRAHDGRGPDTALRHVIPAHFGEPDPYALTEAFYTGRLDQRLLLDVVPLVAATARDGDPVARAIFDELCDELLAHVRAVTVRGNLRGPGDVVLSGGLFRNDDPAFLARLTDGVHALLPEAWVHPLTAPPLLGAALLGLDEIGAPPDAVARASATLTHELLGSLRPGEVRRPADPRSA